MQAVKLVGLDREKRCQLCQQNIRKGKKYI